MARAVQGIVGVVLAAYGTATGNVALAKFGYSLIVSNVLAEVARALAGKPVVRKTGQVTEYYGTVEPRRIIYGKAKVSGMHVIPPWVSGTQNQDLHQVIAVAGHEITGVSTIYFNQDQIPNDSSPYIITPVTGTDSDGLVVSGTYANKAWVRVYLGTGSQTVDYKLNQAFPSYWDSNHRGLGVAYIACTFRYDETAYKTGKPEVSCLLSGKKVYDPRLDTSPGANPTNASYIAYSTNPALCLADYLIDDDIGVGESASRIDWDSVVAAANICDEDVPIPSAYSPTETQTRYTCNTVMYVAITDDERRKNIDTLVTAMMGHIVYRGGKWYMYAGAAGSSTFSLSEDDFIGKISIRTEMPSSEKYNYVRGQFVDAEREYQLMEFEPRGSTAYETEDGGRFETEVMFTACANQYEAQRNALIVLKRGRLKRQVSAELGMSAFKIRPWDVGTITLSEIGWTNQPVRCMSWQFNPSGTISAVFLEEDSAVWDDPVQSEYDEPVVEDGPTNSDYIPATPTSLTATGVNDGVKLKWVVSEPVDGIKYQILRESTSSLGSPVTIVATVAGDTYIDAGVGSGTYYYWVRGISPSGVVGGTYPAGAGTAGQGGGSVGIDIVFARSDVQPTTPTGSYTTPPDPSGSPEVTWYTDVDSVPDASPFEPLWSSIGTRDTVFDAWAWQTPVLIEATPGSGGSDGMSVAEVSIFRRSSSAPSTPTGGTYSFTSNTLTVVPTGWSATPPSGTDPCYTSRTVAAVQGTTGTDSTLTWSTPVIVFRDGTNATPVFYAVATSVSGYDEGASSSGSVTSSNTSTTPYNGTSTYTYSWSHLSTLSGNTPTISSSTISNPYWFATVADGTDSISFWRVVVTDSSSPQQVTAADIAVQLTWVNTT